MDQDRVLALRTFVSLEIPSETQHRLGRIRSYFSAPSQAALRWVAPDLMHVTIRFLGDLSKQDFERVCDAAQRTAEQTKHFAFTVRGLDAFPNVGKPRILYVPVIVGASMLIKLSDGLRDALVADGLAAKVERLMPHVTIARTGGQASKKQIGEIGREISTLQTTFTRDTRIDASDLTVMTSSLGPHGPSYTPIYRRRLGLRAGNA